MDKIIIIFIFLAFSVYIDSKICKVRNQYRWLRCHCYSSNINTMICNGARILSIKQLKIPEDVKRLNLKYNHIKVFDVEFIMNNPNVEVLDISSQSGFNCSSLNFVEHVAVDIISDCARSMDMNMDITTTLSTTTVTTRKNENRSKKTSVKLKQSHHKYKANTDCEYYSKENESCYLENHSSYNYNYKDHYFNNYITTKTPNNKIKTSC